MRLCSLFSAHAVLQRELPIPVWGWTRPSLRVRASLGGQTVETLAAGDGAFLLRLPARAAGGPYRLVVETADPAERVEVEDLLVGEVWIGSGQSNMEWTVSRSDPDPDPRDVPALRMFTVGHDANAGRAADVGGGWQPACGAAVSDFSAVGYHFGRRLQEALGVPVGIVNTSWGGTRIETWISREALVRQPRTRREVLAYERRSAEPAFWAHSFGPFEKGVPVLTRAALDFPADPGNLGEGLGWAAPGFEDSGWRTVTAPGFWQALGDPNNGSWWYRRRVRIPEAWKGRDLLLGIGGADKHDITYVNGVRVGATGQGIETEHWDVARDYPVPAELVAGGEAVIAVRVFSFAFAGGFSGPAHRMKLRPADTPEDAGLALCGAWRARREHDLGLVVPPPLPEGPGNPNTPHILYDRMVAPLVPYAIRGAVWYQGESNAGVAQDYGALQAALIADWRRAWGQGDFPFGLVQLAAYRAPAPFDEQSPWALLREAQLEAARQPGVGMASAIDIGDELNIHPGNKREVGSRLARWALAEVYARPGPAQGPRYTGYTLESGAVRARFDHCGSGLVARGGALQTFFVAGADRRFHPAQARIEGNTVVASSAQVPEPVALRYAWSNNPQGCNLYNAEGLPASPFRTDGWPLPPEIAHES